MMSRAYWTGLIPRSLSSVRSQPSRPIPNRRATVSISWSISAAVTSSFLPRRACSISVRLISSSRIFFPLRATHSSASCWRVMIWPLTIAIGSVGLTGILVGVEPGTSMSLRLTLSCPWRSAGSGWRSRCRRRHLESLRGASAVPVPARPCPSRRRPGRSRTTIFRDRDPLRSSRGVSPIPLVSAGILLKCQRQSGRDSRFLPEIGQSQSSV